MGGRTGAGPGAPAAGDRRPNLGPAVKNTEEKMRLIKQAEKVQ